MRLPPVQPVPPAARLRAVEGRDEGSRPAETANAPAPAPAAPPRRADAADKAMPDPFQPDDTVGFARLRAEAPAAGTEAAVDDAQAERRRAQAKSTEATAPQERRAAGAASTSAAPAAPTEAAAPKAASRTEPGAQALAESANAQRRTDEGLEPAESSESDDASASASATAARPRDADPRLGSTPPASDSARAHAAEPSRVARSTVPQDEAGKAPQAPAVQDAKATTSQTASQRAQATHEAPTGVPAEVPKDDRDVDHDGNVTPSERLAAQLKNLVATAKDAAAEGHPGAARIASVAQALYERISRNGEADPDKQPTVDATV